MSTLGKRAEVVGGGIAGLTVAAALGRNGWRVRVHERAATLRFQGYSIALSLRAQQTLSAIGILEELVAGRPPLRRREARDEKGRLLGHINWPHTLYFIERRVLLERLLDIAGRAGVEVSTGSEVVGANPEGALFFADGRRAEADLVIGADGAHSRIRKLVDGGARLELLDYGAARALAPRRGLEDLLGDKTWCEFWSGRRRLLIAPVSDEEAYLAFNAHRRDVEQPGAAAGQELVALDLASWRDAFPYLAEVVRRLAEPPLWAPFQQVTTARWSLGRVVIIGDAAHAMAPTLGAGGTTAMMDAVSLAIALGAGEDIAADLARWELSHRPAVHRLQQDSRFWGDVGYWPNIIQRALINLTPYSRWLERKRFSSLDYMPKEIIMQM